MIRGRVGKALAWLWLRGAQHVPVLAFWAATFESLRQVLSSTGGGG